MESNIQIIVKEKICTGCGLCESLCPINAISMGFTKSGVYEPIVDMNLCTRCGYCLRICGRYKLDYDNLQIATFGETVVHPMLGRKISCYRGHAKNPEIRWHATSGGVVTTLVNLAYELGMINTAILTGIEPNNPLGTSPFVARNLDDIARASSARYAPSPVNHCLREINANDKVAVVGLPCHFESLRKAENINRVLRQQVVLRLGLFCSHNVSLRATEFICHYLGIPKSMVTEFKYRGNGWPGGIKIKTEDGREIGLPNQNSLWTHLFMAFVFAAPYCLLCTDQTSEFADISCGDAWLPEVMETDNVGESIIITRTEIGESLIRAAIEQGYLQATEITPEKVVQSQMWPLYFKKELIHSRYHYLRAKRFDIPKTDSTNINLTRRETIISNRAWLNAILSTHHVVFELLKWLPVEIVENYARHCSQELWQSALSWMENKK